MATTCPECGKLASSELYACPHCGHRLKLTPGELGQSAAGCGRSGCGCVGLVVTAVLVIFGVGLIGSFWGAVQKARQASREAALRPAPAAPLAPEPAPDVPPPPVPRDDPTPAVGAPPEPEVSRAEAEEAAARKKADLEAKKARRVATLMAAARNLEISGKAEGAIGFYLQVEKEFPGTPQARTARTRIQALAGK